jgi:colanic acid biosynthesis protein WcaM
MLKKITRRRFVSSLSVLAAMPLLSSRARTRQRKTVSVNQYNNNDWIAAFKQAFSEGDTVVVPAGFTCENINTGIFIPDGKTLLIRGALNRQWPGTLCPAGRAKSLAKARDARRTSRWMFAALTAR